MSLDVKTEEKIVAFCADSMHDPLFFARAAFPWGSGELKNSTGPRQWQTEILDTIGKHLRNPDTRFNPLLIAVASGHGIGKSSLISMITNWALSTMPDTKIVTTANTESQLRTKTWAEVSKWMRLSVTSHWFKTTATAISSQTKGHERTWRADAIPWSENQTESFAGLHNEGRRIILIFDEGSAIAEKVYEVAEGALTDENTEVIWVVFGNPTRNSGRFRDIFGKYKKRWITRNIDSRTVEGTNKTLIAEWVKMYGEDSDFVRVRVKGEFPRAGSMQFISSEMVEAARIRMPEAKLHDPFVVGVDVGRFGDDETVICPRRGRDAKSIPWIRLRGRDNMEVADVLQNFCRHNRPDKIFIDGGGVGAGVVDIMKRSKFDVQEVQFGAAASSTSTTYEGEILCANKRAEMWLKMKDWMRGGMIPDDAQLAAELTGLEYGYVMRDGQDKIMLEKKSDMKKRGLGSPDMADALAITFAYDVMPSDHTGNFQGQRSQHSHSYNPLSVDYVNGDLNGYNPYR